MAEEEDEFFTRLEQQCEDAQNVITAPSDNELAEQKISIIDEAIMLTQGDSRDWPIYLNMFDEKAKQKEKWSRLPKKPLRKLGTWSLEDGE